MTAREHRARLCQPAQCNHTWVEKDYFRSWKCCPAWPLPHLLPHFLLHLLHVHQPLSSPSFLSGIPSPTLSKNPNQINLIVWTSSLPRRWLSSAEKPPLCKLMAGTTAPGLQHHWEMPLHVPDAHLTELMLLRSSASSSPFSAEDLACLVLRQMEAHRQRSQRLLLLCAHTPVPTFTSLPFLVMEDPTFSLVLRIPSPASHPCLDFLNAFTCVPLSPSITHTHTPPSIFLPFQLLFLASLLPLMAKLPERSHRSSPLSCVLTPAACLHALSLHLHRIHLAAVLSGLFPGPELLDPPGAFPVN